MKEEKQKNSQFGGHKFKPFKPYKPFEVKYPTPFKAPSEQQTIVSLLRNINATLLEIKKLLEKEGEENKSQKGM